MPKITDNETGYEAPWYRMVHVIDGLTIHGRPAPYEVVNERAVRATAGLTMVVAAAVFLAAQLYDQLLPMQIVAIWFFFDFAARKYTKGTPWSVFNFVGSFLVSNQRPDWVGFKQKKFAWSIGMTASAVMSIFMALGIRGPIPFYTCIMCLTFMWLESAAGICVGCKMYAFLLDRKWIAKPEVMEACPGGACELPARKPENTKAS